MKSNRLAALPASIGQLGGLVELFLTDNRLERLPPEMGQLRNLVKLQVRCAALRCRRGEAALCKGGTHLAVRVGGVGCGRGRSVERRSKARPDTVPAKAAKGSQETHSLPQPAPAHPGLFQRAPL